MRLPLPPELKFIYGDTCFPAADKPRHVFANFVSTLDGIVSLGSPDQHRGGRLADSVTVIGWSWDFSGLSLIS